MLCSLGELGLTTHDFPYAIEDGIFVLGDDCDLTPGADIHDAIGLNDTVTEFEITSNRPDCLSVWASRVRLRQPFKCRSKCPCRR